MPFKEGIMETYEKTEEQRKWEIITTKRRGMRKYKN